MPTLGISEKPQKNRLLLLDASSIFYPAFHVLQNFATKEGFPTGAIYGYIRTVLKLLREYPSECVAVIYDSRGPTIRHDKYPAYKANRPPMDEELAVQIPRIKEITEALGLPSFEAPGYEADDLIATFAKKAGQENFQVLIATGDKDLLQLVNDHVRVLKPSRTPGDDLRIMDPSEVKVYMGVPPEKVRDYLALLGDSVDNVPGVPGVGKKSAQNLLEDYDSLEEILANVENIGNTRARNALGKNAELARLSYDLVGLEDVDVDSNVASCVPVEPDWDQIIAFFTELNFSSFLKELELGEIEEEIIPEAEIEYVIIQDNVELENLISRLKNSELISIDLETTSQDEMLAEIVGFAIAIEPGTGYYIPVGHQTLDSGSQLSRGNVLEQLRPILESDSSKFIGQNLKYDAKVFKRAGVKLRNISFDSMLAASLVDFSGKKKLGELAIQYLGHGMKEYKDLSDEQMANVPIAEAAQYAASDAEVVLRLHDVLSAKLDAISVTELFTTIEMPLVPILVDMEVAGVLIDVDILADQEKSLETQLIQVREDIFKLAGQEFNTKSPKQVGEILFEKLGLPVIKKTKTGPSTDARVLEQLALQHPLPERILASRELEKILNTYVRKLPDHVHPETGRIHSQFSQGVTATGRLSSHNPNLQNIPIRSQIGGQIREAFIAPQGRKFVGADYSQIELRVLAHITEDPGLVEAFMNDADIHTLTAATVFDISLDDVSYEQRDIAKRINFGIAYGMGAFGLSVAANIPRNEAQEFIDSYFENYAGVKAYMDRTIEEVNSQGYVSSLFGRRRYFQKVDGRAEREAINMPIQGCAADLMKMAMIQVADRIQKENMKADMILQIHDELIFEVDEDQAEECRDLVVEVMESVYKLKVPLKVDAAIGDNWGEI
jgi:DNA polymerase-1